MSGRAGAARASAWAAVFLLACGLAPACAAVRVVAPGENLAQVLRSAADGDEVQLQAGVYKGQVGVILQRQLTIRGVGGKVVLQAEGEHAEGKAILVVRQGDVRVEDIEFRGARVPDRNGAGIRFERGRLQVRRCRFVDNENGILTSNDSTAELIIEDSEFTQAPDTRALPHLLYVGQIARFTLTGSRFSQGRHAHLVKSRARENHVFYNELMDGPGGQAAYELEFPNGGVAFVVGNVIGQSEGSTNPTMLSFGAEGSSDGRAHALHVVNNSFINFGFKPALFLHVHAAKLQGPVERRLANNLFLGIGAPDLAWSDLGQGNVMAPTWVLRDVDAGDFRLSDGSWLRGAGVKPGSARGMPLAPSAEFAPPLGRRAIGPRERWSPGAYQD